MFFWTTRRSSLLCALLLLALPAWACIWDSDTIEDELRGLPTAAVLATGRWYRHGPAYYEHRVKALGEKSKLTLVEYDDLAVAYERLGRRPEALEILERKRRQLEATPNADHLYRYYANKGTILAHSGRFDEGLVELQKALELNPEAHFGRERYQVELIRYVVAARKNPELWSEHNFLSWARYESTAGHSPTAHPTIEMDWDLVKVQDDRGDAFQAVAGMLRFGGIEGPELYRCLGDLSILDENLNLAWLFYLKAIEKGHPAKMELEASVKSIEDHWQEAGYSEHPTRKDFQETQENATEWLQAFQEIEREKLDEGKPLDLKSVLEEADKRVPENTQSSPSHTSLWVAVGSIVMTLLALQFRRRASLRR